MEPIQTANPNRNNLNNLLDANILLGYHVRIGCSFVLKSEGIRKASDFQAIVIV